MSKDWSVPLKGSEQSWLALKCRRIRKKRRREIEEKNTETRITEKRREYGMGKNTLCHTMSLVIVLTAWL